MKRTDRHGVAAVEFALVAPLFFFLLLGMIEYGGYIRVTQMMTNISRDAARAAAAEGTTPASFQKYMGDLFKKMGVEGLPIQVSLKPLDPRAPAGTPMTATASIPFRALHWGEPFFLRDSVVRGITVMRKEGT